MDGNAGIEPTNYTAGASWLIDGTLDTVLEINQQCLEYLVAMDQVDGAERARQALSPEARSQLAASPYLLVDARFEDEGHWRALTESPEPNPQDRLAQPQFTGPGASDFIRRVLVFAWHMA